MAMTYSVNYTSEETCEALSVDYVQFMTKFQEVLNSIEACQGNCFVEDVGSVCTTHNDSGTSDHLIRFKLFLKNPDHAAVQSTCDRNCQRVNLMRMAKTSSVVSKAFHDLLNSTSGMVPNVTLGTDQTPIPMKSQSLRRIKADLLCPPGRVLSKYRLCVPCDKGSYIPKQDMTTCLPCPIGTYQTEKGQTKCELCTPSTTTLDVGADHPALCNQRVEENE
jgi:hypothetical protein